MMIYFSDLYATNTQMMNMALTTMIFTHPNRPAWILGLIMISMVPDQIQPVVARLVEFVR